jgi:hypothetical protein
MQKSALESSFLRHWNMALGYIKIKGIHFKHAANGFPVPQRGAVSASRGHHWIIEDCIIEDVNSLGVDLGNEMWHTEFRRDTGTSYFPARNICSQLRDIRTCRDCEE